MNIPKRRYARHDGGFSLIEVLIALVILSVGLLGIAAMVSVSMKTKASSYYRTQALALSNTILNRMRANRVTATAGGYNITVDASSPFSGSSQNCNGTGATCTPAQIATMDLYDWDQQLVSLLGNGTASNVSYNIATTVVGQFTQVQIVVSWNDTPTNQALGATTNTGTNTADSACSGASTNPGAIAASANGNTCYNTVIITTGL